MSDHKFCKTILIPGLIYGICIFSALLCAMFLQALSGDKDQEISAVSALIFGAIAVIGFKKRRAWIEGIINQLEGRRAKPKATTTTQTHRSYKAPIKELPRVKLPHDPEPYIYQNLCTLDTATLLALDHLSNSGGSS